MARTSLFWRATRPWAFTVSVIPPILGALISITENQGLHFNWLYFGLTLIGCMLAHAGANTLSDYFDFKIGVDREGTFGSSGSRVLVDKLMTPGELLSLSLILYLIAGIIASYFVWVMPGKLFFTGIILVGFILGAFYTVAPLKLKYHAFGDVAVFIAFGSAMTLGAYYVQAQHFSWYPVVYALPVALLVDAVLHSNNLRDIQSDSTVNIKTVPILIGEKGAKVMYYSLVIGAYILIPILIIAAKLTWLSLITFISLPLALKLINTVKHKDQMPLDKFAPIDGATAQLHSAFGLLLIFSLIIQNIIQ